MDGVEASGWVEDLLGQLTGRGEFQEMEAPDGFCGTLRPYQQRGYSWLAFLRRWGLGACLADDMGLGKTVPDPGRHPAGPPGRCRGTDAAGLPDLGAEQLAQGGGPVHARPAVDGSSQSEPPAGTPNSLRRPVSTPSWWPATECWAGTSGSCPTSRGGASCWMRRRNIKNPATRQARAARSLGAEYRVALTGTPVENHVGDLWSVMQFLNPGLLGTEGEFKRNYFIPIQAEGDEGAAQRLQRATGPFILRRLKTDRAIITDLPEKMESREFCPLTREQATLYEAVLREAEQALEDAEGIGRRGAILGTLTKLKQVCNHPRQLLGDNSAIAGRSGKLTRLQDMLEENHRGGRPRPGVQPVRRDGLHPATAHPGHLRQRGPVPARRSLPAPAGPNGGAVPGRQEWAAGVHPVAARRRHRG